MATKRHRAKPVPQHLITTPPHGGRCAKCRAAILTCMCYGEPTSLDAVHLSLRGEAMALVAGIATYEVTVLGRGHPFPRSVFHISNGLPKYSYIHPAHRCGVSWIDVASIDERRIFDVHYAGAAPPF